ncbi:MAG TPA: hypothetical protein VFU43_10000 [Streptosporangiaceae bacterium]|nr:hypothetical protein [Streptosporangiaceae bacterium]
MSLSPITVCDPNWRFIMGGMTASRWVRRVGVLAGGLLLAGVGVVFGFVGLDKADKISSSAGFFVGVAGLVVSVYGVILARRAVPLPQQPAPAAPSGPSAPGQATASGERSVVIGGDNSAPIVTGDSNEVR